MIRNAVRFTRLYLPRTYDSFNSSFDVWMRINLVVPLNYDCGKSNEDGRGLDPTHELVIDAASVTDVQNNHLLLVLPNLVDSAVVTDPHVIESAQLQEFSPLEV